MLIYNFAKEFIGIDENDLKTLGFSNLAQLREEAADFADLFVRTPGHVHNFQHVHWIDFVACAESDDESKVIISVNSNTFKANLSVTTLYMTDNTTTPAFLVYLNNLRLLSSQESETVSEAVMNKPRPNVIHEDTTPAKTIVTPEVLPQKETQDETIAVGEEETLPDVIQMPEVVEIEKSEPVVEDKLIVEESVHDVIQMPADDTVDVKVPLTEEPEEAPHVEYVEVEEEIEAEDEEECSFDPEVASRELGLPLDLIEEFVQDFIAQAKEFKESLYLNLSNANLEEVAALSHKLKGVAANLRIENAFNVLVVVNTSKDVAVIKTNLDEFYKIIARLAGEKVKVVKKVTKVKPVVKAPVETAVEVSDDELVLSFKEDEPITPNVTQTTAEVDDEDDLVLSFKDEVLEEDKREIVTESPETLPEEDDDMVLDFKDEEPLEEETQLSENVASEIAVTYSKELAAKQIGLDQESYEELFHDFLEDFNPLISNITQAVNEGDFKKCQEETHALKGMSDSMHLHDYASELNVLATSSDRQELLSAIDRIKQVIKQISE